MKQLFLAFLVAAFTSLLLDCALSKDQAWTVVKDASGAVCAIVLQAADPALAPLCVSLSELEATIQELGTAAPGASPMSESDLYRAVLAHRAHAIEKVKS